MFSTSKLTPRIWMLAILVIGLLLFAGACGSAVEPEAETAGSEAQVAPPPDTPEAANPETPAPTSTPEPPTATPPPQTLSVQERMDQATAYFELGEHDKAAAELEQVIELEPDNADAYRNLGTAYLELGQAPDSAAAYEKAIELNPDYGEAYGDMVAAYFSLGKLPEAAAAGEKGIELAPDYATGYNNLGTVYGAMGRLDEAMVQFNVAKMLDSNDPQPCYNLGYAYQIQGQIEKAVAEYQKAIKLDPDYGDAYENLGTIYAQQGQFDEAARQLQAVIRIDNRASAHKTLGMVYLSLEQAEEGAAALETFLQLAPADAPDRAEVEGWLADLKGTAADDDMARYEHNLDCQTFNPELKLGAFSILYPPEFEITNCRDNSSNYVTFDLNPDPATKDTDFTIALGRYNFEATGSDFQSAYLDEGENSLSILGPQISSQMNGSLINDQPLMVENIPFYRRDYVGEILGAPRFARMVTIPNFENGYGLLFFAYQKVEDVSEAEFQTFDALTQKIISSVSFAPVEPAAGAALAPEEVLQTVFDAAALGDFALLQGLCDPLGENDNDTQTICNWATDETDREQLGAYFAAGKINGETVISPDGTQAEVPFLFGPDGNNEETMELINRDGQWYLFGF